MSVKEREAETGRQGDRERQKKTEKEIGCILMIPIPSKLNQQRNKSENIIWLDGGLSRTRTLTQSFTYALTQ